jgi:hypothetical protein
LAFDPADPRTKALKAVLERTYPKKSDFTISEPPGGGYLVTDKDGFVVLLVVPAGPAEVNILPSIELIASGAKTSAGLAVVRRQTAVPQLESLLTRAIGAARKTNTVPFLLQTIGEIIDPSDTAQLMGLARYLSTEGADPDILATALSLRSTEDVTINRRAIVGDLLKQIADWHPNEIRGLAAMYENISRIPGARLTNFLYFRSPLEIKTALGRIDTLARRPAGMIKGLNKVIGLLTSESPLKVQGAFGVLRAAGAITERAPTLALEFEAVEAMRGGELRLVDIRVMADVPAPAGSTGTVRTLVADVEVKEIVANRLSGNSPEELAKDILNDWHRQTGGPTPSSKLEPFATIQWLVRRKELMETALDRLYRRIGLDIKLEQARDNFVVNREMKDILTPQLEDAFKNPLLDPMRATAEGRKALESYYSMFKAGLPFLNFY